jgi:predicted amidophosphoribosyltransferase
MAFPFKEESEALCERCKNPLPIGQAVGLCKACIKDIDFDGEV